MQVVDPVAIIPLGAAVPADHPAVQLVVELSIGRVTEPNDVAASCDV
jgi:hypothetical protein